MKSGKIEKLAELDILGICETRAGNGDYNKEDLRIIQSGGHKILNTYHVSNRIIMIKIEAL